MMIGIEKLQRYRDEFAKQHPDDPQVLILDQWLEDGRVLAAEIPINGIGANRFSLRPRIPKSERAVLRKFGASFYILTGETIEAQKESREERKLPAFCTMLGARDGRVLTRPSLKIEVAYFPDPKDFFVPGTFGKDTDTQKAMAVVDARRYGLEGITQIVPDQASIFTELTFQYLAHHPGEWLFGREYARAQGLDCVYGRTKNPTNADGSLVAHVGDASPVYGLNVVGWDRNSGYDYFGSPRLVVAIETK